MEPEDCTQFLNDVPAPHDIATVHERVAQFVKIATCKGRPLALVTSGGTTVPLEKNTVRYLDNFSSGSRGAASCYSVIFLHRGSSLKPFQRHFSSDNPLEWFTLAPPTSDVTTPPTCDVTTPPTCDVKTPPTSDVSTPTPVSVCHGSGNIRISLSPGIENKLASVLGQYENLKPHLLLVPFTSVFEYFHYLKSISSLLHPFGPQAIIYLAAAVSDFYVHRDDMSEHKIQSSASLCPHFRHTPKMVLPLTQVWAPSAFTVTFKLETDVRIVIPHAKQALEKYRHQVVVANILDTRATTVTLVTREAEQVLECTAEERARGRELEEKIIQNLVRMHRTFMGGSV